MDLPDPEKEAACAEAVALLADSQEHIEASGIECGIVSAGGTGTLAFTPDCPGLTEIQAGGGIMMDTLYATSMGGTGAGTRPLRSCYGGEPPRSRPGVYRRRPKNHFVTVRSALGEGQGRH